MTQQSTAKVSRRQAHVVGLLGLLGLVGIGLGPGCGDDSGATSHTAGPATTKSSETHGGPTTKGETGSTGDPGTSTTTGDPTTGDTTTEPTTTGEMTTAEVTTTGDTEEEPDTETETDTGDGDGFKVGLQAKSLCGHGGSYMCAVSLDDHLVCWGKIDPGLFMIPEEKVKSIGRFCKMMVLESGELHRLWNIEAKPVDLPPGPFELAGGVYPYGCAMAADNSMTCWVAEGYEELETPPPGPYISLFDHLESACQTCGIRPDGTMECWKVPYGKTLEDWEESCGGAMWFNPAPGHYQLILGSSSGGVDTPAGVNAINHLGQVVFWRPATGEEPYIYARFASGGFIETDWDFGLKESGELLVFEGADVEGVPLVPGKFTTFRTNHKWGCAIRAEDSRVVCWGEDEYGVTDPPQG